MRFPKEKIFWQQLPSGLRVVTVEMPSFYTVSAGLFARVGSRFERPHELGLSHFIEHLLFKGSKKYSARQISELIEGRGGNLNGYTTEESTCFYFKTIPESFFQSLDVLVDLYTAPLFAQEDIEKEREVIIEELHAYEDQPSAYIDDLFSSVIWSGHPLGNLILGAEPQIKKYSKEDVERFFHEHYTTANTVLAIAGAITHEEVMSWMKDQEGRFCFGKPNDFDPFYAQQQTPYVHLLHKKSEQCHLQLGVRCSGRHSSQQWALRLLNTIVGENMSSRLFQEIREKQGLAYHISSDLNLYEDVGTFFIQLGVDADKVAICTQESLRVLKELSVTLVSEQELACAKTYTIGHALQDMESTLSCMLWVGDKLLSQETDFSTEQFCEHIEQVSSQDIQKVAREIFCDSQLNMALIGPYRRIRELRKALVFI